MEEGGPSKLGYNEITDKDILALEQSTRKKEQGKGVEESLHIRTPSREKRAMKMIVPYFISKNKTGR